jgi:hypothetical protein
MTKVCAASLGFAARFWTTSLLDFRLRELLRELSGVAAAAGDFEQLSNGVFWCVLAASLDKRVDSLPMTPFDARIELPLQAKVAMVVHGSLILRLYLSLVYMREGVLSQLVPIPLEGFRASWGHPVSN